MDEHFFIWFYDKERKLRRRIGKFKGRRAVNVVKIPSFPKKLKAHFFFLIGGKGGASLQCYWGRGGGGKNLYRPYIKKVSNEIINLDIN